MGRPEEVAELIRQGKPIGDLGQYLPISAGSIFGYALRAARAGYIFYSDLLIGIPSDRREIILATARALESPTPYRLRRAVELQSSKLWPSDSHARLEAEAVLFFLEHVRVFYGELYFQIWDMETRLHQFVEHRLAGVDKAWWTSRVPNSVQQACNKKRSDEEFNDREPLDPFCYTDLRDLWRIIHWNWDVFEDDFAKHSDGVPKLDQRFQRLNEVRNSVMHPSQGRQPTQSDFESVGEFHKVIRNVVG